MTLMSASRRLGLLGVALVFGLALSACEKKEEKSSEDTMGKAADTMKEAGEKAGEAMKDAGEKAGEAMKDAGEKAGEAMDKAGESMDKSMDEDSSGSGQ